MEPDIGQVVTLEPIDEPTRRYRSRVADRDASALYLDIPLDEAEGRLVHHWPRGLRLAVTWVDASGGVFRFPTTVLGFARSGVPLLKVALPEAGTVQRTQRRQHLRVPALMPLALELGDGRRFVLRTHDVSAGGLSFPLPPGLMLARGDRLQVYVALQFRNGAVEPLSAEAEVVRLWEEGGDPVRRFASVKLLGLRPRDEARLVRFAYDRQIFLREKGLLDEPRP
ncbi:PilZ domain-containing protein [Hydrogenibacillus sp. N12]|uniref:flagellar brake protein n=1 Tax=Hydrogenibacillus sp. N12 TaxID=2866627 RepID=UPI001C7DE22B|nr:PilZ domain-containing protein [Hydrogenibacillus sp. N12]QZA32355.1 PilZ domain-containing protein [Hydrogenibacillus sp. N12]